MGCFSSVPKTHSDDENMTRRASAFQPLPPLPSEVLAVVCNYVNTFEQNLYVREFENETDVCTHNALSRILTDVDPSVSVFPWRRVYLLSEDGNSMQTFYSCAKGYRETLLIASVKNGDIIGCYASNEWKATKPKKYTGSSKNLVFSINKDGVCNVYRPTLDNSYFQMAAEDFICCGGENPILYMTEGLRRGTTSALCKSYDNDVPLTAPEDFDIMNVEMWVPSID